MRKQRAHRITWAPDEEGLRRGDEHSERQRDGKSEFTQQKDSSWQVMTKSEFKPAKSELFAVRAAQKPCKKSAFADQAGGELDGRTKSADKGGIRTPLARLLCYGLP
jgi:hypothetical protein